MSDGRSAGTRSVTPAELLEAAGGGTAGDRRALARLLSVAERGGADGRELTRLTSSRSDTVYSVGITGAPGAGKSTLTAGLIAEALEQTSGPVAVLAVDPTSPLSGGAILGDRVRMQDHALNRRVYIRSMATRGHLGGLAAAVPDALRLLGASGWPLAFVETVGVGQVEVEVAASCDTVVVVLNPGWGDAVQANKAGLLEVADVLVINKADRPGVRETRRDLVHMLQLSTNLEWTPPIVETVAASGKGVHELWKAIDSHRRHLESTGGLEQRRTARLVEETERLATARLDAVVSEVVHRAGGVAEQLGARRTHPAAAADAVVQDVAAAVLARAGAEGDSAPRPPCSDDDAAVATGSA